MYRYNSIHLSVALFLLVILRILVSDYLLPWANELLDATACPLVFIGH